MENRRNKKSVKIDFNRMSKNPTSLAAVERSCLDTRFAQMSHVETTGLFGVAGEISCKGIREHKSRNGNFRNRKSVVCLENEKELVRIRGEPP